MPWNRSALVVLVVALLITSLKSASMPRCPADPAFPEPGASAEPGSVEASAPVGPEATGTTFDPALLAGKELELRIRKAARRMDLVSPPGEEGQVLAAWKIGLGFDPVGDKESEGDGRTPEGTFRVTRKVPNSAYYKAFLISYPEVEDAERGLADGLIDGETRKAILEAHRQGRVPPQDTELGGWIEIHGRGSHSDWTLGCIAADDAVIDLLWSHVRVGTPVRVLP